MFDGTKLIKVLTALYPKYFSLDFIELSKAELADKITDGLEALNIRTGLTVENVFSGNSRLNFLLLAELFQA